MVLAIVDEARAKNYRTGVIGIRGVPDRAITADLQHQGQTVRIRAAESALAARELLGDHRDGDWLVVVTDRDDDDLGAGILAHFIWQRLRSPDPWEAVRTRFAATGIDPALTSRPDNRELATALVAATPAAGWPAAPAGVLTRTHALGAVAATHLGFDTDTADVLGVLRWSIAAQSVASLGALRRSVGDLLADTTLDWIAQRAGSAAGPIRALLSRGELADVVPLGLVLRLLTADRYDPPTSASGPTCSGPARTAVGRSQPFAGRIDRPRASSGRAVVRPDSRSARRRRRRALPRPGRRDPHARSRPSRWRATPNFSPADYGHASSRLPTPCAGQSLHPAIAAVHGHRRDRLGSGAGAPARHDHATSRTLRGRGPACPVACRGRSCRPVPRGRPTLGALVRQYLDSAAWADAAINDAFGGVDDPSLSECTRTPSSRPRRQRRRAQERRFARALASAPIPTGRGVPRHSGTVWYLEQLLPGCVIPLARKAPVLLLVLDGMSAAVATEILSDATDTARLARGCPARSRHPPKDRSARGVAIGDRGESRLSALRPPNPRAAARRTARVRRNHRQGREDHCAALPQEEQWTRRQQAGRSARTSAAPSMTSTAAGHRRPEHHRRRARPQRPRGHGVDRRRRQAPRTAARPGRSRRAHRRRDRRPRSHRRTPPRHQRSYPEISSARSRPATAPVQDDEIEVSGPRVLTDGHRAVLAVDETLRYGPLKAGYHGGASAAEVVVPVAVLVPDETRNQAGLDLLPPQEPTWWLTSAAAPRHPRADQLRRPRPPRAAENGRTGPTLFDQGPTGRPKQPAVHSAAPS